MGDGWQPVSPQRVFAQKLLRHFLGALGITLTGIGFNGLSSKVQTFTELGSMKYLLSV
jgi:hypothetical protein